jgi:hypothetical protein
MAESKRHRYVPKERVLEEGSAHPRTAPRMNAPWYQLKDSLKPVSYSQVKGFFQEEESLERRKVPQALH